MKVGETEDEGTNMDSDSILVFLFPTARRATVRQKLLLHGQAKILASGVWDLILILRTYL